MNRFNASTRRNFLKQLVLASGILTLPIRVQSASKSIHTRKIPSTGQDLSIIGMGTWRSFNVGNDHQTRLKRCEVLRTFFEMGGQMVDSSPMYGSAEEVLGFCIKQLGSTADPLFSATKVWTSDTNEGRQQIKDSHRLWGIPKFNLLQVHNLVNWRAHLDTLLQMKADGKLQYVGITTSHGRRHRDLENIIVSEPIDFVQLTYHMQNRDVEDRLLPASLEKGVAVIANRPFSGGDLFDDYQRYPLPDWVKEFDCNNWAQFFLKFVISHPAITCAIPATSRVDHMIENMGAGYGELPDASTRKKMLRYISSL